LRELLAQAADLARRYGLEPDEIESIIHTYSVQAQHVLGLLEPGPDPLERARIRYSVRHEMAQRLADFLFVSTYHGHERTPKREWLAHLAECMAAESGWPPERTEEEIDLVLRIAAMPD
jgi:glycerol-3-phosphate dehydrogenase